MFQAIFIFAVSKNISYPMTTISYHVQVPFRKSDVYHKKDLQAYSVY